MMDPSRRDRESAKSKGTERTSRRHPLPSRLHGHPIHRYHTSRAVFEVIRGRMSGDDKRPDGRLSVGSSWRTEDDVVPSQLVNIPS